MNEFQNDYINYRLEKAKELFQDAELLAQNNRWNSCINRLYYSSFHLVNALLFKQGIKTKSHEGLKTKFLQLYVKNKIIDTELGKLYSLLIDWRQESEYSVYVEFKEQDVLPLLVRVKKLNEVLVNLIEKEKD
ncbi:Uncharacterized protein, contains HEPN domain, UPF0332 family [Tangfeifania diversioriginum]|uniref:Uncharacterized protein, contains HEPN domain, UPF0332 family n=1 Tax=Tangfeifania diversioriginum TaxID=1168035 RepID=A0A1M6K1U5_9BACT|nr:HEPN domain-containing protein [Tangfeifania diversioriginum]SHJ52894.1 Uncharacterized protein, contains HEPN domain, UPF0332 family [Tangfeifania diversioriginum]